MVEEQCILAHPQDLVGRTQVRCGWTADQHSNPVHSVSPAGRAPGLEAALASDSAVELETQISGTIVVEKAPSK